MTSDGQTAPAAPERIGGCYRVETTLGHGAMARVYRVLDERSGRQLALKQLVRSEEHDATLRAMFEREYYTLVQLVHPRIVRAFDYGLDAGGPYYTMELLHGADLRATIRGQKPSLPEICLWLRDAASALALIHSRRMVHRDLSLRNLWCMPDGRAKLIDFGTLVAMGSQTRIAGTPPFVPPEAAYMQPLDARSDLYALGAVAYYVLTGRNAYPAHRFTDLRELWERRPEPPDRLEPELPSALSDLVMSLLSLDPRARPGSAAEVCERLTAIAGLAAEDERGLGQAFLTSPKLVGRRVVTGFLRKRLLRAIRGRGSAVAVVAPAGLGRSRALAGFVLEAKMMGAATIAVDATAVGSGPLALAGAIVERLLDAVPGAAAAAAEAAPLLGQLSPALHRALGEPALAKLSALERTRKTGSAIVALIEASCREQRLVIAVDDVHRADSASLGVLGRLSVLAADRRLLLVTTCDAGMLAQPPPALEQLVQPRNRIDLEPLAAVNTHELLESLFGSIPGLDEAASWLHELSLGSPQTCMQYAQYLVDQGIARYQAGQWQLPQHLRTRGLPASLAAMFEDRIAALSQDARALALGLALARDESRSAWQPENHVRIEDFPKLLDDSDSARAFHALDELLHAGIVQQRDGYYVLGQRAMVDALLRVSDPEARGRMHGRLAAVFEHGTYPGRMLTVRQLQLAGEHARAREVLGAFAANLSGGTMDWASMRISVSAECTRNALAHWQDEGGSAREGILLRRLLLVMCSAYDWSMARSGDAQLAQLRKDIGLVHWDQTDASLPDLQRLIECLKLAQAAHERLPEAERGLPPGEAVRELAAYAMPWSYGLAHGHDVARARALQAALEPLRPLSPLVALLADLCGHAIERVTGRELGDRLVLAITRLLAATEVPEVVRLGGAAVSLHEQAILDARRGHERALELMDQLARSAGDDLFLVVHGRWLAHAYRGDAQNAQRLRKQAEVITEDDVWRRRAFLFAEVQLYALTGDLLGLQRASEAIAALAEQFPGWRPWHLLARAELHRLRGELEPARAELEDALRLALPGEHRAWVAAAPVHAELRLLQGDPAGARREAEAILASVAALALDASAAVAAERVLGLAHSAEQDHAAAAASLERALVRARELGYDGLPLAALHEAQGRIALAGGDASGCIAALTRLRELLEHADAPALVGGYEALREQSTHKLAIPSLPAVAMARTGFTESVTVSEVRSRLDACGERHERMREALALLLQDSGGNAGHLLLFVAGELALAASIGLDRIDDALLAQARDYVQAELAETRSAAVTVADRGAAASTTAELLAHGTARFAPVLLSDRSEGQPMLAGLALLCLQDARPRLPRRQLVAAVARCLQAEGDSVAVEMD